MQSDDSDSPRGPSSRLSFRFSLLALFLFVTLICVLLAWWVQPRKYVVESQFRISAIKSSVLSDSPPEYVPQEFELLRQTHTDLIRSEMVITSALRDPKVAALTIVRSQADPVGWLRGQIVVDAPAGSELLAIRMRCGEAAVGDCRQLVDAVSQAYLNKVVFEEEQLRLMERDALIRRVSELKEQLVGKISAIQEVTKEPPGASGENAVAQIEIAAMKEILGEMLRKLEIYRLNSVEPDRVRRIQNAISRPE